MTFNLDLKITLPIMRVIYNTCTLNFNFIRVSILKF